MISTNFGSDRPLNENKKSIKQWFRGRGVSRQYYKVVHSQTSFSHDVSEIEEAPFSHLKWEASKKLEKNGSLLDIFHQADNLDIISKCYDKIIPPFVSYILIIK